MECRCGCVSDSVDSARARCVSKSVDSARRRCVSDSVDSARARCVSNSVDSARARCVSDSIHSKWACDSVYITERKAHPAAYLLYRLSCRKVTSKIPQIYLLSETTYP